MRKGKRDSRGESAQRSWNPFPLGRDSLATLPTSYLMSLWRIRVRLPLHNAWQERSSHLGGQSWPCISGRQVDTGTEVITVKMRQEQGGMALFSKAYGRTQSLQGITLPKSCGIQLHAAHNWVESITEYFICALRIGFLGTQQKLSGNGIFLLQLMILASCLPFIWPYFANIVSFKTKKTLGLICAIL